MSRDETRRATIRAGAFDERGISSARYTMSATALTGCGTEYDHTESVGSDAHLEVCGPWLDVMFAPRSQVVLTLVMELRAYRPSYRMPGENTFHPIEKSRT